MKEETFGKLDRPLVVGFATRVELDVFGGDVTEKVIKYATSEIEDQAKSKFQSRMEKFGLKNVEQDGELTRSRGNSPEKFTKYRGDYEVESIKIEDVDIPNIEKNSFTLEGGMLSVEGLLGIWRKNGHIFVAGGVYPSDPYRRQKKWDITGGVHLTLDVDLDLSRTQYRGEVIQFCKSVHS